MKMLVRVAQFLTILSVLAMAIAKAITEGLPPL